MVEHDDLMRQAVAALRASRTPTPDARARVFAALELQLGGPPGGFDTSGGGEAGGGAGGGAGAGGSSATAGASSSAASVGWVAKVVGATASLTGGGLLLVWAGAGVLQTTSPERERVRNEVTVTDTVDGGDVRPLEDDTGLPAADDPAIAVYLGVPAKPRTIESPEPLVLEPADPLTAELALLSAAKQAGTPMTALALLDQHAREYPSGTMASEREALAVVALCRLDRTDAARDRARVLIAQRPSLPLLHRMRDECPALTDLLRQVAPVNE
jgi:hypothetical protein